MAIGQLYTQVGGVTIMNLGIADASTYKRSRQMTSALLARTEDKEDRSKIASMVSDCDYAIEWLETGRRPGNRRGIERRAAYQRERPVDPIIMQDYMRQGGTLGNIQSEGVTDEDRVRIDNVLGQLTNQERDSYSMVIGNGLSYSEAAEVMGIEKGSVQWYVDSAKKKISKMMMQGDLFDFS